MDTSSTLAHTKMENHDGKVVVPNLRIQRQSHRVLRPGLPKKGGQMASELDCVPRPKNVVSMVMKEWNLITGPRGKPLM